MKKFISIFIASCIALLALTGCGKTEKAQNEIEVWLTPQWKGTYKATEKGADYDSFMKTAASMFEKEHPGTKINIQVVPGTERDSKMSVAVQTDTLPDIFFDSSFVLSTYAHQGLLADFNDVVSDDSKKDISQTVWDNVSINNDIYFYPFSQNPGMLVYNADMFKKAGLEQYISGKTSIADWNLNDFETILKKLKAANPKVAPLGFYAKDNQGDTWNMMYLRMFGSTFFNKAGLLNINDKQGVEAMNFIEKLNKENLITAGAESLSSSDVNTMFQNQQVAISFTNAVSYQGILSNMDSGAMTKFDARLANIPSTTNPMSFTYILSSAVFKTNGEKRKELAQEFVKFYSENKDLIQASTNFLPVRASVAAAESKENPLINSYLKNDSTVVNFSNNTPGYAELRTALYPQIQAVLTGEKTSQQALDDFVVAGDKAIESGLKYSKALKNK
ncbi:MULTISPECIES: ABC transporter substrate-binding protein [unclassified Lactococcus]|uniref:ABC transporter substrate-binding protein n=1 Tax=unclassified Lactococcus TaxID=2643510 RepID=UPI0011C90A8D|nr:MULTISPECIES: extracellular solute-binding protein [unclassified Lactococcus]MQW23090.1 extracellular solute-binding protein [Lactococcus sp. dk101]TXK44434.1 extracellular solute-binding protein [Lactococcus sp. dk310]TXK50243.1 extracellular solute-binding protein [Lactococcus sp. dk322]